MTRRWTLLLALLRAGDQRLHEQRGWRQGRTRRDPGRGSTRRRGHRSTDLTTSLLAIEQGPRYPQSDWGYVVLDQETGEVLASQSPVRMFDAGSTMKTFAGLRRARALRQRLRVPHPGVPGRHAERGHPRRKPRARRLR